MGKENGEQLIHSFNHIEACQGNFRGLTKREYFAAMAMQGIMHTREYQSMPAIAIDAVMAADALIEELSK